ncbi:hypothetical protein evm_013477 [Chilo suppressalis]|nr:hypothetical protein evm_013477 [Chilo suppressalis]
MQTLSFYEYGARFSDHCGDGTIIIYERRGPLVLFPGIHHGYKLLTCVKKSQVSRISAIKVNSVMADKAFIVSLKPLCVQNGENAAEIWKKWKLRFEIFKDANEIAKFPESKQVAIFLNAIGDDGIEIFNSFNLDRTQTKLEDVLKKFDEKFSPHTNITVERYNFFTRMQKPDESLEEYLTIINNLATTCDFGNLKQSLIKDMLIIGMKNTYIKKRLLQEEGLTVESTMKIAKSLELSQERSSKLMRQDTKNEMVQGVKEQPQRYKSRSRSKIPDRSRSNQRQNYRNQSTRTRNDWQINIYCNNYKLKCQIDTGADTNVIRELVPNLGTCVLNYVFENGITTKLYFVVVECDCKTIIGWNSCENLGIVKRIFGIQERRRRL